MVVLFLVPYLALSAALEPLTPIIAAQLHISLQTVSLARAWPTPAMRSARCWRCSSPSTCRKRRMLWFTAAMLVAGSVLAAAATGPAMFIVGHVLQGLCTSLLLIAAAPPLFLGYPVDKLRWTG